MFHIQGTAVEKACSLVSTQHALVNAGRRASSPAERMGWAGKPNGRCLAPDLPLSSNSKFSKKRHTPTAYRAWIAKVAPPGVARTPIIPDGCLCWSGLMADGAKQHLQGTMLLPLLYLTSPKISLHKPPCTQSWLTARIQSCPALRPADPLLSRRPARAERLIAMEKQLPSSSYNSSSASKYCENVLWTFLSPTKAGSAVLQINEDLVCIVNADRQDSTLQLHFKRSLFYRCGSFWYGGPTACMQMRGRECPCVITISATILGNKQG